MNKKCSSCKELKESSNFTKDKNTKTGLSVYCKPCQRTMSHKRYLADPKRAYKWARAWAKNNPDKIKGYLRKHQKNRKRLHRRWTLKTRYGLTPEQFDNLVKQQENKCAICEEVSTVTLNVDHCHKTGKIRALLCRRCNRAIGLFKDNIDLLIKSVVYLQRYISQDEL
jgi:hypothetical protein